MQRALGINPFRLTCNNQDMNAWKFRRKIPDPADPVMIFKERVDQQNIRSMFSNQFARVTETVGTATNMIPLVAPDDCSHPLFADTRVPHHHDPAQRE
jgi:hypothetical protein